MTDNNHYTAILAQGGSAVPTCCAGIAIPFSLAPEFSVTRATPIRPLSATPSVCAPRTTAAR